MTRGRLLAPLLGIGISLGAAPAASAQDEWIEVRSPHFTVATNGSERSGRNLAWQFERTARPQPRASSAQSLINDLERASN